SCRRATLTCSRSAKRSKSRSAPPGSRSPPPARAIVQPLAIEVNMKRFMLGGALVGFTASVLALVLPEIIGPSIMYLLPLIFLLAPSFALVFYIFPLHGAPIAVFMGVYAVLT